MTPSQDLREHFLGLVASTGHLGQRFDKNGNNLEIFFNAINGLEMDADAVNQIALLDPERATIQEAIEIATESRNS